MMMIIMIMITNNNDNNNLCTHLAPQKQTRPSPPSPSPPYYPTKKTKKTQEIKKYDKHKLTKIYIKEKILSYPFFSYEGICIKFLKEEFPIPSPTFLSICLSICLSVYVLVTSTETYSIHASPA